VIAKPCQNVAPAKTSCGAFTFVELLVVLALLAILTCILYPAIAASGPDSQVMQCLNDKRQLATAWIMYQGDNNQRLMALGGNTTGYYTAIGNGSLESLDFNYMQWAYGIWVTNTSGLIGPTALMAAYVSNVHAYKCPADTYQSLQNPGPRTRSVSLNAALDGGTGSGPIFENQIAGRTYFEARKVSDLNSPGPANIFAFLDEQADSIDDMLFDNNEGYARTQEHWRNLPAGYHNGADSISFADGHCEEHHWQVWSGSFPTVYPVHYINYPSGSAPWSVITLAGNADYEWLDNRTPYIP
jgi:prepilin-type N-terminal cleavage/methylation domain-containing protein